MTTEAVADKNHNHDNVVITGQNSGAKLKKGISRGVTYTSHLVIAQVRGVYTFTTYPLFPLRP